MIPKFDFHMVCQMLASPKHVSQWDASDGNRYGRARDRLSAMVADGATHAVLYTDCDTSQGAPYLYEQAAAVAVGPRCAHKSVADLDMLPLPTRGGALWPRCYCILPGARVQSRRQRFWRCHEFRVRREGPAEPGDRDG